MFDINETLGIAGKINPPCSIGHGGFIIIKRLTEIVTYSPDHYLFPNESGEWAHMDHPQVGDRLFLGCAGGGCIAAGIWFRKALCKGLHLLQGHLSVFIGIQGLGMTHV